MRGAVWDVLWSVGTPALSVPLAAAAAVHVVIATSWAARGSPEGVQAFRTSSATWVLAAALILDSVAAAVRALRLSASPTGTLEIGGIDRRDLGGLLVRFGYVLLALAFAWSLASRDGFRFRCAVGEDCTGSAEQIVAWDLQRPFTPGQFALGTVQSVEGAAPERVGGVNRLQFRAADGSRKTAGGRWPLWKGWGTFLWPRARGDAFRYEVGSGRGEILESAFVKLDLAAGASDQIVPEKLPHRIYVRREAGEETLDARVHVAVYRGKLLEAESLVRLGDSVAFEGLTLRLAEWRPWVELEVLRDPGIPLGAIGLLLVIAGVLATTWARSPS